MAQLFTEKTFLALVAAGGYGLATIVMKVLAERPGIFLAIVLATIFLATIIAEILLLQQVKLGLAYIAIIATETALVLAFAAILGEGLTGREWVGAGFVFFGIYLVSF